MDLTMAMAAFFACCARMTLAVTIATAITYRARVDSVVIRHPSTLTHSLTHRTHTPY